MAATSSSSGIHLLNTAKSPQSAIHNQSAQCSFLHRPNLNGSLTQPSFRSKPFRGLVVRNATPDVAGDLLSSLTSMPEIPGFHLPDGFNNSWLAGVIGLGLTMPLLIQRLLTLTKGIDMAAQTVEKIADVVEHVAEEVDKAAEGIAEALPEGGLKDMVHLVEELAEETAKDAQKVEDLMDQVEELDDKLEEFLGKRSKGPEKA